MHSAGFEPHTHIPKLVTFDGHSMNVTSVSFHSEGKWLVTGSEDGTIKIWDLRFVHQLSEDLMHDKIII